MLEKRAVVQSKLQDETVARLNKSLLDIVVQGTLNYLFDFLTFRLVYRIVV